MSEAKRFKTQLLLDFETAYKTAPSAATAIKLPFNSCDIRSNRPIQQPGTIRSNRNPTLPFRGNIDVSGNVVVPLDLLGIGYWLKLLLGSPDTTGSISPYTHVYKVGDTVPSAIIEKGFTDITEYHKYTGCKANTFAATLGGDGDLAATFGIIGAGRSRSATAYDVSPTDKTSISTKFENYEAAITEGGSPISTLTEVSLNIENNLDGSIYCIGDAGERSYLPEGMIRVYGNVTGIFDGDALYAKGRDFTESALVITLTDGSYSLAFDIGELVFAESGQAIPGPGNESIFQTLDFEGFYHNDADVSAIKITLRNSQASY